MTDETNGAKSPKNDLLEDLDATAKHLLSKCREDDKVVGDEKCEIFIEQVKAFQAVADWAKVRHQIDPPPPPGKEQSAFGAIRDKFNGAQAPGRRSRRSRAQANGTAASDAFGSDGTDSANGVGLGPDPDDIAELLGP